MADELSPSGTYESVDSSSVTSIDSFPDRQTLENALGDIPTPDDKALEVLPPEERVIGMKLLPGLISSITEKVEARGAKKLSERVTELNAANDKMMRDEMAKFRARQEPPKPEELEKLLSQGYETMPIKIPGETGERVFEIGELPQAAEKRLMDVISKHLLPHLKELSAIEFTNSSNVGQKIQVALSVLPTAMDMMADLAVIALNPYNKDETITREWVQNHLNSSRITNLIEAQIHVGKIRDFISAASRLIPS